MFTGIVSAVGQITHVQPLATHDNEAGLRLRIEATDFDLQRCKLGDSIAIQGACMTVVELEPQAFSIEISRESLNRTVGLDQIGAVNLEHAMRLGDTLDGHMVLGHVDGVGQVSRMAPVGESYELRIIAPTELAKYLAYKGSVTVNGVSLTVNEVVDLAQGCEISINLIPHTVEVTTLKHLQKGSRVNLEVDAIARYVERMMSLQNK
ncbi:riboflavin synthase [Paenalcaligenes hominis]|uniref:Riboflavin synthase n=1 Tax=Paenalcaligenes hominis TaxID=643674 RepID=A0A1U9JZT5_9BURK|nr:riboflavin synthase [Paenalcaligenes hominis]AQS51286.1 riboflavin synthase [Paenalcaligenes hominis]